MAEATASAILDRIMLYQAIESENSLEKETASAKNSYIDKLLSEYPGSEAAGILSDIIGLEGKETEEMILVPEKYALNSAYPNPFNPATTIQFDLPEAAIVDLRVFNLLGNEVWRYESGKINLNAGRYHVVWNGRDNDGNAVSTGMYIIRISTPKFSDTKKVMLVK